MLLYQEGKLLELGQLAYSLAPPGGQLEGSPGSDTGFQPSPEFWVAASAYLTLCGTSKQVSFPDWKEKVNHWLQLQSSTEVLTFVIRIP